MKKGVVLVLTCSLVAVGLYLTSSFHRGELPSPQRDVPAKMAKSAESPRASQSTSGDSKVSPEIEDLMNDLDTQLGEEGESISARRDQPPQVLEPENVAEQTQLALDIGYIEESQVPEFQRQRERLNSIIQEQQESEMGEAIEDGVTP